jgi:D-serine ammonia-lyase
LDDIAQKDMSSIQQFVLDLENHWETNVNSKTSTKEFFENFTISVGSTPSLFRHSKSQEGWKDFLQRHPTVQLEIHAGNYTLYDRQQLYTHACPNEEAIAGRVLSRVIGNYDDDHRRQTILLDAGATALTKEATPQGGMAGIAGPLNDKVDVYRMSQEVSMARPKEGASVALLDELPLGSMVALLPNHSCLAAACFDTYYVIHDPTGQFAPSTPIVEEWTPVKGW